MLAGGHRSEKRERLASVMLAAPRAMGRNEVFALPIRHDSRGRVEFARTSSFEVAFTMASDEVASIERRDADQMVNLRCARMIGRQARIDELLTEPANPTVAPEYLQPELLLGSRAAAT
jgi:hypothetical protein